VCELNYESASEQRNDPVPKDVADLSAASNVVREINEAVITLSTDLTSTVTIS